MAIHALQDQMLKKFGKKARLKLRLWLLIQFSLNQVSHLHISSINIWQIRRSFLLENNFANLKISF